MSDVQQISLPAELVHAILIQIEDEHQNGQPIKGGLTACSLTCRFWARVVRPMLFERLTIRSPDDIVQLLAFLNALDPLHLPLGSCIEVLYAIEDLQSPRIPWCHQIFSLRQVLPEVVFHDVAFLTIEGSTVADQFDPKPRPLLPCAMFPRTLPGSTTPLGLLRLRRLQLPSIRELVKCVQRLGLTKVSLEEVIFAKGDVEALRPGRSHSHSRLLSVSISYRFDDPATFQYWFKVSNILFASQGRMRSDGPTQALTEKLLLLLLTHGPGNRHSVHKLLVTYSKARDIEGKPPCSVCAAGTYCSIQDVNMATPHMQPMSVYYSLEYTRLYSMKTPSIRTSSLSPLHAREIPLAPHQTSSNSGPTSKPRSSAWMARTYPR